MTEGRAELAGEVFRTAAESIELLTSPYDEVVGRARELRRRRRRTGALGVAAAAVLVGATTWWATRPPPPPAPLPTHVVAMTNPVGTAWYAEGRLHLHDVAVDVPDVTDLAAVGDDVVYLDREGHVGLVAADGERTLVGTAVPGSRVLGSGPNAWAVWERAERSAVRIVVWSVGLAEEVATLVGPPETRLVAVDQDRVYYQDDSGAFSWAPTVRGAVPVPLGPPQLVGVSSGTRVYQRGHRIEMVQPFFSVSFVRRGEGASVSPGGNFVLSRRPGPWLPGMPFVPLLYDTRSGARLPSGVARDELVVDAVFGDNRDLLYLVAQAGGRAGSRLGGRVAGAGVEGPGSAARPVDLLVLRSCQLETRRCRDVVPVPSGGGRAIFAD